MKIVIVDDNLSMRMVLKSLFESQGHEVVADLNDGSGLLECIKQKAPDLACLDYNLPGMNGLELLEVLQATSPDVDVVMVTGSNDPELNGRAANAGAAGFLHKPFTQVEILEELKQIEEARRIHFKASFKPTARELPATASSKHTAVIVDDSGTVRVLLQGILEGMGISVLQMVGNGAEGVTAAKRHQPSIVCLDVSMPLMSGLEALPQIRVASPNSKVIMVTGNASKSFVETAISGGAKGYILKPVRPAQVETFMKKLLAE
ncbi:MAG: response regulator [Sulfuritalea sp.]|nr:response regulator [Sulfuritalea sp.]